MKELQCDFTTPEQSKRLLELGVPADSADCYLNSDSVIILNGKTFQENYNEDLDLARMHLIEYPHYVPCWSVGRLIEIYLLCAELKKPQMIFIKEDVLMMDRIINELCYIAESKRLDFSKLEEE